MSAHTPASAKTPAKGPRPFPLQLIGEESITPAMDAAIRNLLCVCFPTDTAVFSLNRHWHSSAPAYSFVHQQDGRVHGHVGIVLRTVLAGDTMVEVAGIQNLAVRPDWRGTGLSHALMSEAMAEAKRRGIRHGLLFCVPALEGFYNTLGWSTVPAAAMMLDEQGRNVPIPGKNISMVKYLARVPFPPGPIDLQGPDW